MFRVGDKVMMDGQIIWNITGVDGKRFAYDVIYHDHVSPNTMVWNVWLRESEKFGWKRIPREKICSLPEELFEV